MAKVFFQLKNLLTRKWRKKWITRTTPTTTTTSTAATTQVIPWSDGRWQKYYCKPYLTPPVLLDIGIGILTLYLSQVLTHMAAHVVLQLLVELRHRLAEVLELRDDQIVPHDLGDQRRVGGNHILELEIVLKKWKRKIMMRFPQTVRYQNRNVCCINSRWNTCTVLSSQNLFWVRCGEQGTQLFSV